LGFFFLYLAIVGNGHDAVLAADCELGLIISEIKAKDASLKVSQRALFTERTFLAKHLHLVQPRGPRDDILVVRLAELAAVYERAALGFVSQPLDVLYQFLSAKVPKLKLVVRSVPSHKQLPIFEVQGVSADSDSVERRDLFFFTQIPHVHISVPACAEQQIGFVSQEF